MDKPRHSCLRPVSPGANMIDTVRLGMIYKHEDGHILMQWFHLQCVDAPTKVLASDIEGLNDKDMKPYRAAVFDWLSRRPKKQASPPLMVLRSTPPPQARRQVVGPPLPSSTSRPPTSSRSIHKPPLAPPRRTASKLLPTGIHAPPKAIIEPPSSQPPKIDAVYRAEDIVGTMQSCLSDKRHASTMMMS
ncbi:hypothetical protein B5M09_003377 [Aphanomyces astaci]|uniref:PARP-type domain-containing protein n=1 Tax=Aphanomyces astaci TaxID=112090 RepID=A0A425CUS6_APHAT|nr:hypothetical protein B5M09_003377 [Aphanomyces astaci]